MYGQQPMYGNGFGDIWWTDKLFYFSCIDEEMLEQMAFFAG